MSMCCAGGILWSCGTEPMKFTATNGQDTGNASADIQQELKIEDVNVAGLNRWSRVRSMTVIGDFTSEYTLGQSITLDDETTATATAEAVNEATVTTWPTSRHTPEWRLPQQKCAVITISLTASPAVATWTAIELEVLSQGNKAPPRVRQ